MDAKQGQKNIVAQQKLHHDRRSAEEGHIDGANLLSVASNLLVRWNHAHNSNQGSDQGANDEAKKRDKARILHTVQKDLVTAIRDEIVVEESPFFAEIETIGNR